MTSAGRTVSEDWDYSQQLVTRLSPDTTVLDCLGGDDPVVSDVLLSLSGIYACVHTLFDRLGRKSCLYVLSEDVVTQSWILSR